MWYKAYLETYGFDFWRFCHNLCELPQLVAELGSPFSHTIKKKKRKTFKNFQLPIKYKVIRNYFSSLYHSEVIARTSKLQLYKISNACGDTKITCDAKSFELHKTSDLYGYDWILLNG